MAFGGRKAPGAGDAQLPFTLRPPFSVAARMGVYDARALVASAGARGCIGLRDTASSDEHRLCVTYDPANLEVAFGGETRQCPGATRASLDLHVDESGANVVASYRCGAIGPFEMRATAPSLWAEGERWNAFVAASGLAKGAQAAFDDLRVSSGPVGINNPEELAFLTFEALRFAAEAGYQIEVGNFAQAAQAAGEAQGKLDYVASTTTHPAAKKLLGKASSSLGKMIATPTSRYHKGLAKLAVSLASALEALEADL
jgi:hypothetical protein